MGDPLRKFYTLFGASGDAHPCLTAFMSNAGTDGVVARWKPGDPAPTAVQVNQAGLFLRGCRFACGVKAQAEKGGQGESVYLEG